MKHLNISLVNPNTGGACDANKTRKRLNCVKELEVEGLRLGRFPFASAVEYYLRRRHGMVARTTEIEDSRKLRYLSGVLEELKKKGKIRTTDPRHMTREDIQAFMEWMRDKHLDVVTEDKYLRWLNAVLRCFKNSVIDQMKADYVRFPKVPRKPIRVISIEDLRHIFVTLDDMPKWSGSIARGMIALYFATGVRPSEARLAHLEDLDLDKMIFFVRHPKGEGSWASPQNVDIIRPDMMPFLKRYIKERHEWVDKHGMNNATALFPSISSGEDAFYTAHGLQQIKEKVEALSGVSFKLKDFRSTLTTMTVNEDLSRLPAMQAQLRHLDPKTTQRSYVDIQKNSAGKQLKDAWKEHPVRIMHETPLIEFGNGITGYA